MVGLFLGVGLAFFFEYLDNTVKTPEDVEQLIRLPSFGMVPEISYERRRRLEKGTSYPVELITHGHPKSMLSEAYRNIRTSILLSFSEKPPKKIVITSPNPVRGKDHDRHQYGHCPIPDRGAGAHHRCGYEKTEDS